ncbi:histidine phosphatase family protein [Leptospira kmetyi]|uniref:Histidine phosphatase family protein n=1 Tax=Leptospira kmetyi TaxID=408139 RepID=A0AAD0UV21_9LEPT|nr:histidine phosphatase family protein [Leptospira kmetyi]
MYRVRFSFPNFTDSLYRETYVDRPSDRQSRLRIRISRNSKLEEKQNSDGSYILKKTLYLIRNSDIGLNFRFKYVGRLDPALSPQGIEDAKSLGNYCKDTFYSSNEQIYLSPSKRSVQTWKEMGLDSFSEPICVPALQEIDFGNWEGKSFSELEQTHPEELLRWAAAPSLFSFPSGESFQAFVDRIDFIASFLKESSASKIVLVTHGGVISTLICLLIGIHPSSYIQFQVKSSSVSSVEIFSNGSALLTSLNQYSAKRRCEWPI